MFTDVLRIARCRHWLCRLVIPVAALCTFGVFALLDAAGLGAAGLTVLRFLGVEPGPFPFLDIHAVLAAAECHRQGFDVYVSVPCDALGRLHSYSPLWLSLVPLETSATAWVGAILVLACILALPLLIRPRWVGEVGLLALAVFSPMTLYALERANNDLVVLLLVVAGGILLGASRRLRFCSYGLIVLAALLKYYPAVLLALVARERRRDAVLVLLGVAAVLVVVFVSYQDVLARALAKIPIASYFTDSFSARNLPFGMTKILPQLQPAAPYAIALLAMMSIFALARVRRTVRLLDTIEIDWTTREMRFAAIGGLLLTGCFFAGQNVNYRGIYFLMVLPALVQLRGTVEAASVRRWLSLMIAAVLFVMWGEFFRRGLQSGISVLPNPEQLGNRIAAIFWILREFVWWWLIAGLAALAASHISRLPLLQDGAGWVARYWPSFGRTLSSRLKANQSAGG